MNVLNRWTRSASALAAATVVAALATTPATAGAAPARIATTTSYTDATFLQHALGLPTSDTSPAIDSITYDHLQWLLQQPGKFAILIGDPALDPTFAARAQEVETKAKAAGVEKVYWFDPNLSGSAQVGSITEPALDIRNPSTIPLAAASQTTYGHAWLNLIGQYLGNGVTTVLASGTVGDEDTKITATALHPEKVNDYGSTTGFSTKVGSTSGGALYDYSTSATPANVTHSYFFVYDKDRTVTPSGGSAQPAKIATWVDLTDRGAAAAADVATAISTVGAGTLASLDEFDWWKSSINWRQSFTSTTDVRGKQVPVITDAQNAASEGGWRINQITYPQLVDLLKSGANDANAVILFGGTWCPNTRPVIPAINRNAQENDVTVFNYDTVLDGGTVGGATTSATNPLQTRNTTGPNAASTVNNNASFLYGDVVSRYLGNLKTEYVPTTNSTVTYYPGADNSAADKVKRINKLQVPFVLGYKGKTGDEPADGVTRQWIIDKGNGAYTEYMSQWWLTNPQPNQLGITAIPQTAPIWQTINAKLADFTWKTDLATVIPNTGIDTDDAPYLIDTDKANVTPNLTTGAVSVSSNASGTYGISPAALSAALTALGDTAPVNLAAAKAALVAALKEATPDTVRTGYLYTVVGAWGVAQNRKSTLLTAWGSPTSPGTIAGGVAAVHALDVFFGGLPGGVVSRRTVTADPVKEGTAPTVTIAIANDYGRVPTGNVSLVVKQGGTTVASQSVAVAQDAASFTLPPLGAGTYAYTLSYAGDDQIAPFTETGSLTVESDGSTKVDDPLVTVPVDPPVTTPTTPVTTPIKPPIVAPVRVKASKVKGAVVKAPTRRKAGRYKVTITAPKGATAASGKVTVKLKKGKTTKTVTGKLSRGVVTVTVPKLAKGTWKVTITWPGDTRYLPASATGGSVKVTK